MLHLYDSDSNVKHLIDLKKFKDDDKKGIDVPFFNLEDILATIDNFSNLNKLGQGGFWLVYKVIVLYFNNNHIFNFVLNFWIIRSYLASILLSWFAYIYIPLKLCFVPWCHYKNLFCIHAFTRHQAKSLTILFCFPDHILSLTLLYLWYSFLYMCRL